MLKKLIKSNKPSKENLITALLNPVFNQEEVDFNYTEDINLNEKNEQKESLLHICARNAYLESFKWLLKQGLELEAQTLNKETPLFYAVKSNNYTMMKFLIEEGTNTNHKNIYNRTALQEAVIEGNKTYKLLLENTNDLNNKDIYGNNLIFDAVSNGSNEIVNTILKNKKIDINCINNDKNTILHKESVLKNHELALNLLENGANPTLVDKNGKNFLFYAILNGIENELIIDKAIEYGCEVNYKDFEEKTVLNHVVSLYLKARRDNSNEDESFFKLIKKLISYDINVNSLDKQEETVLFEAIRSEDNQLINLFLNLNVFNINHKNIEGQTILSEACFKGFENIEIIEKLLAFGADVNIRDNEDSTIIEKLIELILHYQNQKKIDSKLLLKSHIEHNYYDLLEYLLKNTKVDLKKYNSKSKPLFFDVVLYYNFELFKLLKYYGININQKDLEHCNVIFYLIKNAHTENPKKQKLYLTTLQSLINLGVNINEKDENGASALHIAILDKGIYTVKLLLNAKPNYNATDNKGRTIIHNVVWKDCSRTFRLINSYDNTIVNKADTFGILPINYAAFMGKYDLVITMLDEYAHINNTNKIDKKMLEFFKKYHKNILTLPEHAKNAVDEKNLKLLKETMKKEFSII